VSGFFSLLEKLIKVDPGGVATAGTEGLDASAARAGPLPDEAPATRVARPPAASRVPEHATALRAALAVRDWADPNALLPSDLSDAERRETLDAVAPDVETSWRLHPGQWHLRDMVRRDILTTHPAEELAAALATQRLPGDAGDPVLEALRLRREPLSDQVDRLDPRLLTTMQASLSWLAPRSAGEGHEQSRFWYHEAEPREWRERIAALLERRRRDADVARMSKTDLYDRARILHSLLDLTTRDAPGDVQGQWVYLSGIGGSGKSTLFAHLEHQLSIRPVPPLVVHLDCDEPGFDPTDIIALDISLFRQVAVAVPAAAPGLRSRVSQLMAVADGSDEGYITKTSAHRRSSLARQRSGRAPLSDHTVTSYDRLESAITERLSGRISISWDSLTRCAAALTANGRWCC
jgi:hypothetical protein